MHKRVQEEGVEFSMPGSYCIRIQGRLQSSWLQRLGDMSMVVESEGDIVVTSLQGQVRDQAELAGILSTLHYLHLPLLSLQRQDPNS